ncbi:MAG: transporter substrate-binding protein, partial [bacterium]
MPFGSREVGDVVRQIVAADPDVILSTVAGDSGVAFVRGLRDAGVRPEQLPLVTFSMAEDELRDLTAGEMVGNYAAWGYFQSLERPENLAFVRAFKTRYGVNRTTSDVIASAYD